MSEQTLNSLFGMLSTKVKPASGIQKSNSNSIQQTNHGKNGFHTRLVNSMKNATTHDNQNAISTSFNNNNTKDINQVIEMVSFDLSNNINGTQIQLNHDIHQDLAMIDITNFTINNNLSGNSMPTQTGTSVLPDNIILNQESTALIEPRPNLLKVINETISPVSDKPNSNQSNFDGKISLNILTDSIKNASTVTDRTSASVQIPTNTISDNILFSNNGSKTIIEQDSNLLNNMKAPTTPFTDKLNTNQSNSLINVQDIFEMPNKPNPDKVAVEKGPSTNAIDALLKTNTYPGELRNTASSENNSKTLYNHINENSRLNAEGDGTNPALQKSVAFNRNNSVSNAMFEAKDNTTTNNSINHNTLLNPEENINSKIDEHLKEQHHGKIPTPNTSAKLPSQQGLAKIDPDNNESSIIFNTSSKPAEANFAKSSDNTALTHNNGTITGDVTSPDNSSFNNQSSDILSGFDINPVNARKSRGPEINFTDTLLQINNTSKPLGTLSNNVADNIIQSAKLYMEGGKSEIKIQLSPPELGTLKLEFTVDDDILDAKITVERSAVKDIIEKDIPRLRELISGADIDVGKLDVSLQEKDNDRFGFMDKNLQPDSESNNTQESSNQEKEHFENEEEEESITKYRDSNQINYLV